MSITRNHTTHLYSGHPMWRPKQINPLQQMESSNCEQYNLLFFVLVLSALCNVVLLACVSGAVLWYFKIQRMNLSDEEDNEFRNGKMVENEVQKGLTDLAALLKFNQEFELNIGNLMIDKRHIIGLGNFGIVYKGIANGKDAAVKGARDHCSKSSFKSFLSEVNLLCYLGSHPNIVEFIGAYTKEIKKGVLYIATKYCTNGSLENFLRKKLHVAVRKEIISQEEINPQEIIELSELHRYAMEVANGMSHLETMKVVHGDLSARNVLLNKCRVCKISDFGLSRKLNAYQKLTKKSQGDPLPWKWMAYESLTKLEFTSKSDIWSYGITLWEIFSLGGVPYGALGYSQEFHDTLMKGMRLKIPQYTKMVTCWDLEPSQRPNFENLLDFFKELCSNEYINYS